MTISEQDRARVRAVKQQREDELLALPTVVGVDIDEVGGQAGLVVFAREPGRVRPLVPADIAVPVEVRPMTVELQPGVG